MAFAISTKREYSSLYFGDCPSAAALRRYGWQVLAMQLSWRRRERKKVRAGLKATSSHHAPNKQERARVSTLQQYTATVYEAQDFRMGAHRDNTRAKHEASGGP